jgi:GntR family transcriptional regulator
VARAAAKPLNERGLTYPRDLRTDSTLPAHVRIERWLMQAIDEHRLVPGDKLPLEAQLAADLGVSRMTLRQALASLEAKGVLERRRGRTGGNFIAQPKIECDLSGLAGFTEQMRRAHVRAGARVIEATTLQVPAVVATALELPRRAHVHRVIRVRSARAEPLALEQSYFPATHFPDLLEHRLTGSLYSLLRRKYGHSPYTAREELEPVIAEAEQAELLRIGIGAPLMAIQRTAYTVSGLPIEFAQDLFRPDRVKITLQTSVQASVNSAAKPLSGDTKRKQ